MWSTAMRRGTIIELCARRWPRPARWHRTRTTVASRPRAIPRRCAANSARPDQPPRPGSTRVDYGKGARAGRQHRAPILARPWCRHSGSRPAHRAGRGALARTSLAARTTDGEAPGTLDGLYARMIARARGRQGSLVDVRVRHAKGVFENRKDLLLSEASRLAQQSGAQLDMPLTDTHSALQPTPWPRWVCPFLHRRRAVVPMGLSILARSGRVSQPRGSERV